MMKEEYSTQDYSKTLNVSNNFTMFAMKQIDD